MSEKKNVNRDSAAEGGILDVLCQRFGEGKVKAWQKEYAPRKLNVIEVEDKLAVLRPIRAEEVSQYTMIYLSDGMDKASSFLLNELWLDGDKEMIDNEDYFISAMQEVDRVVSLKKSAFYKL